MADKDIELEVKVAVNDAVRALNKLQGEFKQTGGKAKEAKKSVGAFGSTFSDLARQMTAANLASRGIEKAISAATTVVTDAISAAKEHEETNIRLGVALKNAGENTALMSKVLNDQSSRLEVVTGHSDELLRSMQATAIAYGANAGEASEYVKAAISLANATDKDVNTAFQQLVKTLGGLPGELGESLSQLKELTAAELKSGAAVDLINKKYGEFIDLEQRGVSGSINRLGNAFASLTEAMVTPSGNASKGMEGTINGIADAIERLGGVVARTSFSKIFKGLVALRSGNLVSAYSFLSTSVADEDFTGTMLRPPKDAPEAPKIPGEGKGALTTAAERKAARDAAARRRRARLRAQGEAFASSGSGSDPLGLIAEIGAEQSARRESIQEGIIQTDKEDRQKRIEAVQEEIDAIHEKRVSAIEKNLDLQERAAQEEARIAEEKQRKILGGISVVSNALEDQIVTLATGGKFAADAFFGNLLMSLGKYMISQGMADILRGTAMTLSGVPNGSALIATGTAEVAFGTAVTAGGAGVRGNFRTSGEPAASGPGDSFASGGGFGSRGQRGNGGPDTVIINVEGAVTEAEVGRKINDALQTARRQGLI